MEWDIHGKERISDKLAVGIFVSALSGFIPAGSRFPIPETLLKRNPEQLFSSFYHFHVILLSL